MGDPENRPKLGLVHGGQTSEYLDIGSGLLVDIAEIEGEDAEEVGTTNNYDELEFENENSNNGSDSINAFRVFGKYIFQMHFCKPDKPFSYIHLP